MHLRPWAKPARTKPLAARRAEAPFSPSGVVETLDLAPGDVGHRHDGELSDSVSSRELNVLPAVIDQQNVDFTSIARVDETGPVHHTHPAAPGMARSRQHQARIAGRNGHSEAGGDSRPLPRCQSYVDSRVKIDGGIADMCSSGNWQFPIETYEVNLHGV